MEIDEKELAELRRKAGLWEQVEEIASMGNCGNCIIKSTCSPLQDDFEMCSMARIIISALKEAERD